MKAGLRRGIRWVLIAGLAVVVLAGIYITVVMFPSPFFSHAATFGIFRVYANEPLPAGFDQVIADLNRRLLDPTYWGSRTGFARQMWESQLLVEFLGEVQGYRLDDLVKAEVTRTAMREQMMSWYRDQLSERAAPSA